MAKPRAKGEDDGTAIRSSKGKKRTKQEEQPPEQQGNEDEDDQALTPPKSKKHSNSGERESKAANKEKRKKLKEKTKKREEEKACDLPGQKHQTPAQRDPLRIFFETLYRQLPDNETAAVWMMEWGLLPPDEAKKVYEKVKKNQQQKLGSPGQPVKNSSKVSFKREKEIVAKSVLKTKKRKVKNDTTSEDNDNFISSKKKIKRYSVPI